MPRRAFISAEERIRFDSPPVLTQQHRTILLDLPTWATTYMGQIQSSTNKIGFLLQLGYFRITNRFFVADRFEPDIINWLCARTQLDPNQIDLTKYTRSRTAFRHRETILAHLGYQAFDRTHEQELLVEAQRLAHLQTRPALVLDALTGYLQERRIEIPPYNTLRLILIEALQSFQANLEQIIDRYLQENDSQLLDTLLGRQSSPPGSATQLFPYRLTHFKRISQSMQPGQIKQRVELFRELKLLFSQLAPLIVRLNLSDDAIRYYAQYVLDTQSKQTVQRTSERYLRLIAFIIHQYLSVGDALVLTLRQSVTSILNECEQTLKDEQFESRYANAQLVHRVTRRSDIHIQALVQIEEIVDLPGLEAAQKIDQIRDLFQRHRLSGIDLQTDKERLIDLKTVNQSIHDRDDFYDTLERASLKLQTRVAGVVQALVFDEQSSPPSLVAALRLFQATKGEITQSNNLPLDFLDLADRQRIFTLTGKLRVSLYKALLFWKIRDHLRDGSLNVLSSYEHRAFDEYLIPRRQWQIHRQAYLQKANLLRYEKAEPTLAKINERLNAQFRLTNQHLNTNAQVYFDKAGDWHLHRYRGRESEQPSPQTNLYPTSRVISLRDVLLDVDELTDFLSAFEHQGFAHKPSRPDNSLLLAALIGYGENIGIRKMAMISKNIPINSLETVATHYFSPESVLKANDLILTKSNELPLTEQFRRRANFIQTGSDGQKYDVSIPLLRASASYKYFGNGQGITIYSHLDEAGQLIYSTAFSAADREAPYMLDAITYNEVITPDAHATDQHGFSEPIFGVTGLIGVEFRPRFASIHRQRLYSLDAVSIYKEQGCRIGPDARIDYEHVVSQWDEILRLVATIKLGYAKASLLFKRLNSYDRQHPLYRALRDLGRLFKTEYILRYISEPQLRETVEGILTRVEHANRFAKAVNLGNNGELGWATYQEQLIAEGCKRLIMNAINYWNLLYLSEQLKRCANSAERKVLLEAILQTNTHTWHHVNLQGEYDFSDDSPLSTIFKLHEILSARTVK
ncbi:MAG: Tn3 family transposase [Stigonema ocellatum SAG 48.90 = DSM 106950]|uniref:Tn3 family transposase n=1 Tax=Spirosoma sp. TaxID=1899569 RepID=UPI00261EA048|nr:Tn3 family transposase [Spirosoma sp.]MBR8838091.1 Tn3 family transposase [Stigonema ocellatum SAG 48.90 = DSM 106950]MCX6213894.1 Tn3 family transposase [Spirosoma sp.]